MKALMDKYRESFERYAQGRFSRPFDTEKTLLESVKYSFFAGGKRLRPVLMLAAADHLGVEEDRVLPFAFALECIHTYSLIHDDLPAMDNDDYRRGRYSNHKVYGEATAILAGDALYGLAFSVMAEECCLHPSRETAECARIISDFAGIEGMIAGQSADIKAQRENVSDEATLSFIVTDKTAKLITAALLVPAVLAGRMKEEFTRLGNALGMQFQVVDDILDVKSTRDVLGKTTGKDTEEGKLTYVTLYGVEKAEEIAENYYRSAVAAVEEIGGSEFFLYLCRVLKDRIR